jgi:hypothetical protein
VKRSPKAAAVAKAFRGHVPFPPKKEVGSSWILSTFQGLGSAPAAFQACLLAPDSHQSWRSTTKASQISGDQALAALRHKPSLTQGTRRGLLDRTLSGSRNLLRGATSRSLEFRRKVHDRHCLRYADDENILPYYHSLLTLLLNPNIALSCSIPTLV